MDRRMDGVPIFNSIFQSYRADKRVIIKAVLNGGSNLRLKVKVGNELKS